MRDRMREVQFSSELKTRQWLIKRQTEAGSVNWSFLSRWGLIDWLFWRMPTCLHYRLLLESCNCVTGFDVIASERESERDDHLLMPPLESGMRGGGGGGAVCWEESSVRNLSFSALGFTHCVVCVSVWRLLITDAVIKLHIIHFDSTQTFTSRKITQTTLHQIRPSQSVLVFTDRDELFVSPSRLFGEIMEVILVWHIKNTQIKPF